MNSEVAHPAFTENRIQTAPEITLYYRDFGPKDSEKLPVIFLPGYFRNSRDFEEIAAAISHDRRVITPDLRGRGQSDRGRVADDYIFDRLIEDVLFLLKSLGIERAIFGGTALGVHLTWVLAETHPEMIAGIIINDTGTESASTATNNKSLQYAGNDELSYDEALTRIKEQNAGKFLNFGEAEWERMTLRAYAETERGTWVRDFDQVSNQIFPALIAKYPNWWPQYRALAGLPTAILRGENSDYLSAELAERMAAENPEAKVYLIRGSGHAPTLWEPDARDAVNDFLTRFESR